MSEASFGQEFTRAKSRWQSVDMNYMPVYPGGQKQFDQDCQTFAAAFWKDQDKITAAEKRIGELEQRLEKAERNCTNLQAFETERQKDEKRLYDAELTACCKSLERWPLTSGCNGHLCVAGHLENILDALTAAEAKLAFAQLLARAVLGCSITCFEACDQTIAIYSSEGMIWAAWDGHGELDDETNLPKDTPELRAKLQAAIDSKVGVESPQDLREKLAALDTAEAKLTEQQAEIERLKEQDRVWSENDIKQLKIVIKQRDQLAVEKLRADTAEQKLAAVREKMEGSVKTDGNDAGTLKADSGNDYVWRTGPGALEYVYRPSTLGKNLLAIYELVKE